MEANRRKARRYMCWRNKHSLSVIQGIWERWHLQISAHRCDAVLKPFCLSILFSSTEEICDEISNSFNIFNHFEYRKYMKLITVQTQIKDKVIVCVQQYWSDEKQFIQHSKNFKVSVNRHICLTVPKRGHTLYIFV